MHPVENIRGSASSLLAGRRIVLAISGSIGAVKCVELSRELIRHGADVHAVMTGAAQGIITAEAMHFATGNPVVTKITGAVEHVRLLGDVPGRADLLLVAPATANTVAKMALGIDDTTITTCATVAFGTRTPVVVAPAMHEAMLEHPIVAEHQKTLVERLGVTWIEPKHEEKKAKLADIDAIVDGVIRRLHDATPVAGKRILVIGGATGEPVDPVRIVTNRSSGRTAVMLAQELHRLGAEVDLWYGLGSATPAAGHETTRFQTHADLMAMVDGMAAYDEVWMPAAINDYAPVPSASKIASEAEDLSLALQPLAKVIEAVRKRLPEATIIAFKAESDHDKLLERARSRLGRYDAQWIVANTDASFSAEETEAWLLGRDGSQRTFAGDKRVVLRQIIHAIHGAGTVQVTT